MSRKAERDGAGDRDRTSDIQLGKTTLDLEAKKHCVSQHLFWRSSILLADRASTERKRRVVRFGQIAKSKLQIFLRIC